MRHRAAVSCVSAPRAAAPRAAVSCAAVSRVSAPRVAVSRAIGGRRALTWRAAVVLLAAVLTGIGLAGCTGSGSGGGSTGGDNRYVAGDGKTIVYPSGQRQAAPAVSGGTLDGGSFDLSAQRGNVVVINFWASWCSPCRLEAKYLEDAYQATKDAGVVFVGVNSRDGKSQGKAFAEQRFTYPSLFDPNGRVALSFPGQASALPSTIIIDRSGRVAVAIHDAVRPDTFTDLVRQIAHEQSPGD